LADKTANSYKALSDIYSNTSIENTDIPKKTDQLKEDINFKSQLKNP